MTILNTFGNVDLKKTIFTIQLFVLMVLCSADVFADCPQSLGCNDNVQISLDYDCYAVIHPNLILEDEMDDCPYMVTILDLNDNVIATTVEDPNSGDLIYPAIDGSFVGQVWKASVSFVDDNLITISCWGYFTVEDKLPPTITCIEDITVDCSEDLTELFSSESDLTYCSEVNPADMDIDGIPSTTTICLNTTDMANPWEIVESVLISGPVTGSGTGLLSPASGSGSLTIGAYTYHFTIDPVTGQISSTELVGVQATEDLLQNKIYFTVASSNDLSDGICLDIKTSSFFLYQTFDNCDPSTEVIITRDEIEDLQCDESNLYTARRDIAYFTKDNAGLSALPCDFSIYFEKKSLGDLDFPDNIKFSCSDDIIFDEDGNLDLGPHIAGYPTLDGDPLSDENNLCRINVTFTDDTFNICGVNTLKILRRWTALDWCAGEYTQAYQSIKVHDTDAPEIICPDEHLIYEADGDCTADIIFKPLDQSDTTGVELLLECSSFNVEVLYQNENGDYINAFAIGNNMFQILDLGYGYHTIKYVFTDECGNQEECTFEIRVIDDAAPIPVCDQFTAVVLADNGWARAYTQTFDDGSYDDCDGPISFQIRRPDLHCAPYDYITNIFGDTIAVQDTMFNDFIEFCCEDAGNTVDVILKVIDAGGRYNTCLVKVEVQDKTPFKVVSCPQLIWDLDCLDDIDTTSLGYPVIDDNCASATIHHIDNGDINSSCGKGTIIRSWFVNVNGQDQELVQCRQIINVSNRDVLTHFDFQWPDPIRTDATCSNYHTDLGDTIRYKGLPVNEADICGLLAYSFKDRIFQNVEGFCLKIIRTWTVIDWCTYDPNNNIYDGIWTDTQIIKVSSNEGPELSNCSQDTTLYILNNTCSEFIFLETPSAYDRCFDENIAPNRILHELKDLVADTIVAQGLGNLLSTGLAKGHYSITWSVVGACGIYSTCSSIIDVLDHKAPTPYCKSGISTVLMPPGVGNDEPQVEIWAKDFDLNSSDNCDPILDFSFDPDGLIQNIVFTCDELGLQTLDVWVIDDSGNKDFCHTAINIQANGEICPPDSTDTGMMIAGQIMTEYNEEIESVEVRLQTKNTSLMNYLNTDKEGRFAFENIQAYKDYVVEASNDTDFLNGVSTLDLILIQRHILGIEKLDSPYKLIAADINNNEEISAIDLIELRKLILGVYESFPQNESWRFSKENQTFTDVHKPWPFVENIDIHNLSDDMMSNDFIAVKIGDVNGSVVINNLDDNHEFSMRSSEDIELSYDILEIQKNTEYLIPIYLTKPASIYGLQTGLKFRENNIEVIGIESGKLDLNAVNYHISERGMLLSWNDNNVLDIAENEALFYLTVKSDNALSIASFNLIENNFRSEIYTSDDRIHSLRLSENNTNLENRLYQNVPNPFSGETEIEFELSKDMEVNVSIIDANGQLVKSYIGFYKSGMNSIKVNNSDLNGNGIYYFNLESEAFSATKKMILIE